MQVTDFTRQMCQSWFDESKASPIYTSEYSCPVTLERAQLPNSGYVLMSFTSTQASLKAIQENISVDATDMYLSLFNRGSHVCYRQRYVWFSFMQ